MLISALPLPLSCTVTTTSVSIIENGESVLERNNRLRVQISLLSFAQPVTTIQLDAGFIGGLSSIKSVIVVTLNIY